MFDFLNWFDPVLSVLGFIKDHYILLGIGLIILILGVGLFQLIENGNPLQKLVTGFMTGGASILAPLATKIGLIIIVCLLGMAGYFYYEKTVADYAATVTTLQANNKSLQESNASLTENIKQIQRVNDQIIAELASAKEVDAQVQTKIDAYEKKLNASARAIKLTTVKNSSKAQPLLDTINKDVECQVANINNQNGHCINGIFQLDRK